VQVSLQRVRVAGTGAFLPNAPVPQAELERVLGALPEAPQRVKAFVENMGPRILRDIDIETRHFAVDPETHRLTHTIVSLAEPAARQALEAAGRRPGEVELLILAAPAYDYSTPPSSALLQERLGIQQCAEIEIHSNCSGVGKAVQIAGDALRLGRYRTALVVYSQLSSVYVRNCYFNQAQMNKTQAALRYILADGSGALLLEAAQPGQNGAPAHEVLGTYLESVGTGRKPGMTAGGGIADLVAPDSQIPGLFEKGCHHLDQDFTAVGRDAVPLLLQGTLRMLASLGLDSRRIDHYVYSIPGRQLYEANLEKVTSTLGITPAQVQFRAQRTGYVGGASILIHLDEMVRSGELRPGQLAVVYSVESSKWMSGGFVVRW
jgi:3-oxoacyl-[acyl-carrier-protein] synthase-3